MNLIKLNKFNKYLIPIAVFALFIATRIPALGYDTFNTDVWKWKQRIYDFGTGVFTLDFDMTIQKYHPGVTLMWIGAGAVKVFNAYYRITTGGLPTDNNISIVFELNFLQKLFIVFVLAATVALIFLVLRRLFGNRYAILATTIFSLEPFYLALSREIHLEGLMTTFMIASFVYLFAYTKGENKRQIYISGFFAALAALTKSSALFLLPFTGLALFIHTKNLRLAFKNYGPWILSTVGVFVLLWPAMWVSPIEALRTLGSGVFNTGIDEGHIQLWFGQFVENPGSAFYPVAIWLKTSWYVVVGALATPFIFRKLEADRKKFVLYLALFAVLYLVEMTIPSKKLDRYILPAIMALVFIAAIFFEYLIARFAKSKKLANVYMAAVLIPAIVTAIYLHPNYFSYYSPLGGGLSKGMFIIGPKWTFGQRELVAELDKIRQEDGLTGFEGSSLAKLYYKSILREKLVVAFPIQYFSQLYPFVYTLDGWPTIDTLREDARQSNYFVYPVWDESSEGFDNYPLVLRSQVYLHGTPIYNIYYREDASNAE